MYHSRNPALMPLADVMAVRLTVIQFTIPFAFGGRIPRDVKYGRKSRDASLDLIEFAQNFGFAEAGLPSFAGRQPVPRWRAGGSPRAMVHLGVWRVYLNMKIK
jgi:hypothetical protein